MNFLKAQVLILGILISFSVQAAGLSILPTGATNGKIDRWALAWYDKSGKITWTSKNFSKKQLLLMGASVVAVAGITYFYLPGSGMKIGPVDDGPADGSNASKTESANPVETSGAIDRNSL